MRTFNTVLNQCSIIFYRAKEHAIGLSSGYDIIKAHGGEIKVETKEEEGSTFIIQLPIS